MKLKKLLPLLLSIPLILSGCNEESTSTDGGSGSAPITSESGTSSSETPAGSSSSEVEPPEEEDYAKAFNEIKSNILTKHNYRLEVHSYLPEHTDDEETIYDDYFVNIDDKIYYNKFYSGISGKILQKNQGYINFVYAGEDVLYRSFYATNYNKGISYLYDLVAENLFIGSYTQDSKNKAIFKTTDTDNIAVASDFSGYMETAWFVAEDLSVEVKPTSNQLVFTLNFTCWYIEDGEGTNTPGVCTITIKNIGSTRHKVLEDYCEDPTNTFTNPTKWSDEDKELFDAYNAGTYPALPVGTSYAYSVDQYLDKRDGKNKAMLTDYNSGNLSSTYGAVLEGDGFSLVEGVYTKVFTDVDAMKKTTYTVEMAYKDPNDSYYGRKFGDFFPKGAFQILYRATTVNIDISTVKAFNDYLQINGYDAAAPLIPFDNATTVVSNFTDKTADMNAQYGGGYFFYSNASKNIKFTVSSHEAALSYIDEYIALCKANGFTVQDTFFDMISLTNTTDFKNDSIIFISNPSQLASDSKIVQIRYQIYSFKDETDIPKLSKIEITSAPTMAFTQGDEFIFDGTVFATDTKGGYKEVNNEDLLCTGFDMSKSGTQTVTVSYTKDGITKSTTYQIYVASTENIYRCEFSYATIDRVLELNLSDDGTGTYSYSQAGSSAYTATMQISYKISGSTITFTLRSEYQVTDFLIYSLFAGTAVDVATATGTIEEDGIHITVCHGGDGKNPSSRVLSK